MFVFFFDLFYQLVQIFLHLLFKPSPPKDDYQPSRKPFGRIAVIGAGLTGVSSAAHCTAHNFDVVIYDKNPSVGGIWSHVNSTSGLQINSLIYRFHPGVFWREGFPKRDEILSEITRIWREYRLESRTRFNSEVTKVERVSGTGPQTLKEDPESKAKSKSKSRSKAKSRDDDSVPPRSKWLVYTAGNDEPDGPFDAIIATVGTCGDPAKIAFDGTRDFESAGGRVVHSSELDQLSKGDDDDEGAGDNNSSRHGGPGETKSEGGDSSHEGPDYTHDSTEALQPEPGVSYADKVIEGNVRESTEQLQPEPGVSYAEKAKAGMDSEAEADTDGSVDQDSGETDTEDDAEKHDKDNSKEKEDNTAFQGPLDVRGKTVAIIGSGASGIEAAEWAVNKGAGRVWVLARDDKWIIPRNVVFDTLLSMQPFGREMPLSFIPEALIRSLHYRDLAKSVAPQDRGLFEGTPIVNDEILTHIRSGLVRYVRCDTERLTEKGVLFTHHADDVQDEVDADVVILATGFKRPSVDFLPKDLYPPGYERPNLYLQNFSTEDWSVLMTNAAYTNAIGTVGHFHIGIYTRILLTFLLDKNARPRPDDMKLWVDCLRFLKRGAHGGALGFFTYAELTIWLVTFHILRIDRIRWIFFIMQGWGVTWSDRHELKVE